MATKLKNLKIRKVDFVDEGANPDAHIVLYKHRDGGEGELGEKDGRGKEGFWKRLASIIREAVELAPKEVGGAVEGIQKENAASFNEKLNEAKSRKIADEIWDLCYALQSSICSILSEEGMDSAGISAAMKESLGEFHAVMEASISDWAAGNAAGIVKKEENNPDKEEEQEGEEEEMKIDKSKLTPAELAFLESIEKRCGMEEAAQMLGELLQTSAYAGIPAQMSGGSLKQPAESMTVSPMQQAVDNSVEKSVATAADMSVFTPTQTASVQATAQQNAAEDIYKGLHPAVKAELEELKKFRENAEERELTEVAKKYAIIGKKEEELVPMLKGLKAAGGSAYDDMIAVLDQAVDTVEKSGVFSEIGKAGGRGAVGSSAEAKISEIAKGYIEKDPNLSCNQALAKAWEDRPDILEEYEKEAGF